MKKIILLFLTFFAVSCSSIIQEAQYVKDKNLPVEKSINLSSIASVVYNANFNYGKYKGVYTVTSNRTSWFINSTNKTVNINITHGNKKATISCIIDTVGFAGISTSAGENIKCNDSRNIIAKLKAETKFTTQVSKTAGFVNFKGNKIKIEGINLEKNSQRELSDAIGFRYFLNGKIIANSNKNIGDQKIKLSLKKNLKLTKNQEFALVAAILFATFTPTTE